MTKDERETTAAAIRREIVKLRATVWGLCTRKLGVTTQIYIHICSLSEKSISDAKRTVFILKIFPVVVHFYSPAPPSSALNG
jgi:hypothetical protein